MTQGTQFPAVFTPFLFQPHAETKNGSAREEVGTAVCNVDPGRRWGFRIFGQRCGDAREEAAPPLFTTINPGRR
jgi:hypothetical protein